MKQDTDSEKKNTRKVSRSPRRKVSEKQQRNQYLRKRAFNINVQDRRPETKKLPDKVPGKQII